jgi:putative hemolysin
MPTRHTAHSDSPERSRTPRLIDLHAATEGRPPAFLKKHVIGYAERILAIDAVNAIHQSIEPGLNPQEFCRVCLDALDVNTSVTEQELAHIPGTGPLIMLGNHPFGGLEGIILAELLLQVRSDVRILANYLLARIPALKPIIIPVDPIDPRKSARSNARALKQAMEWVSRGGALLTFPSGEVSHWDPKTSKIVDPPWSPHVAKIALKARAKVLPVFTHGRNSILFNLMGMVHPRLRTLMLPREMVRKKGSTIQLTLAKPIAWRRLSDYPSAEDVAEFLRFSTYLLRHRKGRPRRLKGDLLAPKFRKKVQEPIVAPVPRSQLIKEIDALAEEHLLTSQKEFRVFLTTADRSPGIMREIGRLREASFRDVGEGSGKCLDIDRFDAHYLQLFLWNADTVEIVGAYRMACTDAVIAERGLQGLYSSTLFHYDPRFLSHMGNALELGRSFIRTEYQKKFGCLAILWRGIGAYVARNRTYRYLFGPVSISQNYHTISKNLMVAFLKNHSLDARLAPLVKPKQPVKISNVINGKAPFAIIENEAIDGISMLVSEIEQDQKGVPTLIKHYLKLNGKFLGFNLDRTFSNVIDGLVVVDLLKTDLKLAQRFMGESGARAFYAHHCPEISSAAA